MKVAVFDYTSGEEQTLPSRYLDEIVEHYCVGTEEELTKIYTDLLAQLNEHGHVYVNKYILLKR